MATDSVSDFLSGRTFAVVGASTDHAKYGYIVYQDLKRKGYQVMAVNPRLTDIEGDPCWPDLAALPHTPDGVILVVPPPVTEQVVGEALAAGINKVWMQPGAESDEAVRFCREHGMTVVSDDCVMVRTR